MADKIISNHKMMGDKMIKEIYYKPEYMWRDKIAIDKLAIASGLTKEECQKFLENQVIY